MPHPPLASGPASRSTGRSAAWTWTTALVIGLAILLQPPGWALELAESAPLPTPVFPVEAGSEPNTAPCAKLKPLLAALGGEEYEAREAAVAALRRLGAETLPYLKELRQHEEEPEIRARLDEVLLGPRLGGLRAAEWARRLPEAGYEGRLRTLDLLAEQGERVFPQAHEMLGDAHPLRRWAGLWLCARLGAKARPAQAAARAWLEEALARAEREACAQAASAHESPAAPWPIFLKPRDPDLGDPPVIDFLLGSREGDGYSYPYEIRTLIQRALCDEGRAGTVRACTEPPAAAERPALLWGTLQAFVYGLPDRDTRLAPDPALELAVVAYALERLGAEESDRELLKQARTRAAEWLSEK